MKHNTPRLLFTLGLCLLPACGTEIGNGKKPPEVPATDTAKSNVEPGASAPDASNENENEPTTTPASTPADESLKYLLIACGSPIPELKAASFKDTVGSSTVTVTLPATDTWTLKLNTLSSSSTVTKKATVAAPYGIASVETTLGTQTCTDFSTTLNGAVTEKQITYSDNFKTTWTIDGSSQITGIKVEDGSGILIRNFVLQ